MKEKLTILIVEDEIFTAKSLQMDLLEFGFNVLKPVSIDRIKEIIETMK